MLELLFIVLFALCLMLLLVACSYLQKAYKEFCRTSGLSIFTLSDYLKYLDENIEE